MEIRGHRRHLTGAPGLARRPTWPNARIYDNARALLAAEAGKIDFVDIATPPSDHAAIALEALSLGAARPLRKAAGRYDRRGALDAAPGGEVGAGALPLPQLQARAGHQDGAGPAQDAAASARSTWSRCRPSATRTPRGSPTGAPTGGASGATRAAASPWTTAATPSTWRSSGSGRTRPPSRARATTLGPFDTEDDFSCSLRFPTGIASAHLSWNAGVRKVLYTLHGERGAIRVEDDDVELAVQDVASAATARPPGPSSARRSPSDWMDSSHVTWFNSLFDDFKAAIAKRRVRRPRGGGGVPLRAAHRHGVRLGPRRQPRAPARRAWRRWPATTCRDRILRKDGARV